MPSRMRRRRPQDESNDNLRSHTAELLHEFTSRHTKMVAAEFHPWSLERVYNQTSGRCANPLEILTRWLDRVVLETGDLDRPAPVLAFLNQRYRTDDTPGDGVDDELVAFIRATNDLVTSCIEMAADGLTREEAEKLEQLRIRQAHAGRNLTAEAGKVAGQNGTAATH